MFHLKKCSYFFSLFSLFICTQHIVQAHEVTQQPVPGANATHHNRTFDEADTKEILARIIASAQEHGIYDLLSATIHRCHTTLNNGQELSPTDKQELAPFIMSYIESRSHHYVKPTQKPVNTQSVASYNSGTTQPQFTGPQSLTMPESNQAADITMKELHEENRVILSKLKELKTELLRALSTIGYVTDKSKEKEKIDSPRKVDEAGMTVVELLKTLYRHTIVKK